MTHRLIGVGSGSLSLAYAQVDHHHKKKQAAKKDLGSGAKRGKAQWNGLQVMVLVDLLTFRCENRCSKRNK